MSLKNKTNKVILDNYRKNGLQHTLTLCKKMLEHNALYREGANFVLGEITESVLEVLLTDYISKRNLKDWFFVKGMIVKDIETMNKEFSTEIDMVLFSPQKIYLFECKGYAGAKELTGKGSLIRHGRNKVEFDVFEQHKNHATVFMNMFNPFVLKGVSPSICYKLGIFDFSSGQLKDNREEKWKKIMPVIRSEDLFELLDKFARSRRKWNMEYVRRAVKIIEAKKEHNTARHLEYVTNLSRLRNK